MDDFIHILAVGGTLTLQGVDEVVFGGGDGEVALRQLFGHYGLLTSGRVYSHKLPAIHACARIIIGVGAGQPVDVFLTLGEHLARSGLYQTAGGVGLSPLLSRGMGHDKVFAIGRETDD